MRGVGRRSMWQRRWFRGCLAGCALLFLAQFLLPYMSWETLTGSGGPCAAHRRHAVKGKITVEGSGLVSLVAIVDQGSLGLLARSLDNWQEVEHVGEIVILYFGPRYSSLAWPDLNSPSASSPPSSSERSGKARSAVRYIFVKVGGEVALGRLYNLAIAHATFPEVFKVQPGVLLSRDFFAWHCLQPQSDSAESSSFHFASASNNHPTAATAGKVRFYGAAPPADVLELVGRERRLIKDRRSEKWPGSASAGWMEMMRKERLWIGNSRGLVYAMRDDLAKVGGYDERVVGGDAWLEEDLVLRLLRMHREDREAFEDRRIGEERQEGSEYQRDIGTSGGILSSIDRTRYRGLRPFEDAEEEESRRLIPVPAATIQARWLADKSQGTANLLPEEWGEGKLGFDFPAVEAVRNWMLLTSHSKRPDAAAGDGELSKNPNWCTCTISTTDTPEETREILLCQEKRELSESMGGLRKVVGENEFRKVTEAAIKAVFLASSTLSPEVVDSIIRLGPGHVAARLRMYYGYRLWDMGYIADTSFITRERWMIVHVQYGLANRMRALSSVIVLSRISNRRLLVVWEADHHSAATFGELFELPSPELLLPPEKAIESAINTAAANHVANSRRSTPGYFYEVVDAIVAGELSNFEIYNLMDTEGGVSSVVVDLKENPEAEDGGGNTRKRHIYIKSAFTIMNVLRNGDYMTMANNEIRAFRLVKVVRDIIARLDGTEYEYGVHIRMQTHEKNVFKPQDYLNSTVATLVLMRSSCHYEYFVEMIHSVISTEPSARFFISADTDDAYERLDAEFPRRISWLRKPECPSDSDAPRGLACLRTALADMYLLARSKQQILSSDWSSFSELASRIGGVRSSSGCAGSLSEEQRVRAGERIAKIGS